MRELFVILATCLLLGGCEGPPEAVDGGAAAIVAAQSPHDGGGQ